MGEVAMILSRPRSSWNGTGSSNLASVIRAIPLAVVAPICEPPVAREFCDESLANLVQYL